MDVKQLRLKLISGINTDGEIIYSESYDLTDRSDIDLLQLFVNKIIYLKGFIIEKSYFEKDKYNQKFGENEFQPVIEVIQAQKIDNNFVLDNDIFRKMEYHVIRDSILEVRNDLNETLINSRYGINDVLEHTEEMLIHKEKTKKFAKII